MMYTMRTEKLSKSNIHCSICKSSSVPEDSSCLNISPFGCSFLPPTHPPRGGHGVVFPPVGHATQPNAAQLSKTSKSGIIAQFALSLLERSLGHNLEMFHMLHKLPLGSIKRSEVNSLNKAKLQEVWGADFHTGGKGQGGGGGR
eukprot:jgi/Botrbrau1/18995/Bobra.0100s0029.1